MKTAMQLIEEVLGWWHRYYAEAAIRSGIASFVVALVENSVAGVSVFYRFGRIGVIYYVVVNETFRKKGIGKALVCSVEELLEPYCRFFVATTSYDNVDSLNLFRSLGYAVLDIETAYELMGFEVVETLVRATCAFEDDVFMLKPLSLTELSKEVRSHRLEALHVWRKICYEPWLRMRL